FHAADGKRVDLVTGVQACALPSWPLRRVGQLEGPLRDAGVLPDAKSVDDEPVALGARLLGERRRRGHPARSETGDRGDDLEDRRSEERRVGEEGRVVMVAEQIRDM